MEENGQYSWSPNGGKPKKSVSFKGFGKTAIIIAIVAILVLAGMTCFYTVDDKQQAVVTTFGKVTDITDAGVHFKLPFGRSVRWMSTSTRRSSWATVPQTAIMTSTPMKAP